MRKTKYGNKKTVLRGIRFDSKKESARYIELLFLLTQKKISDLKMQVPFQVFINEIPCFKYKADFVYIEDGKEVVEDVKGAKTAMYRLKKKCVEAYYGIQIKET